MSEYRKANQAMRSRDVRLSNGKAEQREIGWTCAADIFAGRDKIYACEKIGRWVKEFLETIFPKIGLGEGFLVIVELL